MFALWLLNCPINRGLNHYIDLFIIGDKESERYIKDRYGNNVKYHFIHPGISNLEDLFDWKERGAYLFGKESNITVYNSCTIAGNVKVGNNSWIGPFSSLDGSGGLEIGSFCCVSAAAHILSHDTVKWSLSRGALPYERDPVKIGDCCFIGVGAVITKGVNIGNHCLIGAGSVVTKDVPDNSIVLGIPAKVRGKITVNNNSIDLIYD